MHFFFVYLNHILPDPRCFYLRPCYLIPLEQQKPQIFFPFLSSASPPTILSLTKMPLAVAVSLFATMPSASVNVMLFREVGNCRREREREMKVPGMSDCSISQRHSVYLLVITIGQNICSEIRCTFWVYGNSASKEHVRYYYVCRFSKVMFGKTAGEGCIRCIYEILQLAN